MAQVALKRTVSLPLLILYGLGTMLGAGIYVLLGKVAGYAGVYTPVAFLIAALVAGFTGLAYAELASRYPESAGEVIYVHKAFSWSWLSSMTGWLVIATGTISAATIANGFTGYLEIFIAVPEWLAMTLLIAVLGLLAAWGISESVWTAAIITVVEIGGLLMIIIIGSPALGSLPETVSAHHTPINLATLVGVLAGAHLAFYAYIGFEDMINIAEEVRNPRRTLPIGIILAMAASTILYTLVAMVAIGSLSPQELAQSDAPLATIISRYGYSPALIAMISLFAVVNGALVQIIMASRVLYGMGKHGLAARRFAEVSLLTRTPLFATAIVTGIILLIALSLPIETLARLASSAALFLFALINGALLWLKTHDESTAEITVPVWIPLIGLLTCLAMAGLGVWEELPTWESAR